MTLSTLGPTKRAFSICDVIIFDDDSTSCKVRSRFAMRSEVAKNEPEDLQVQFRFLFVDVEAQQSTSSLIM